MAAHFAFLAASAASMRRASSARTISRTFSSSVIRFLSDASLRKQAGAFGLPLGGISAPVGAHQKGELAFNATAFSFAPSRLVAQPVTPSSFPMEAALEDSLQREFPLLTRMDGPAIVPEAHLRHAKTYREAVRLCWQLRRVKGMTYRQLAAECELTHQHVGDYFNNDDKPTRRSLPGDAVASVESVLGNTAITQWHARNAKFTVLEELQAGRAAA